MSGTSASRSSLLATGNGRDRYFARRQDGERLVKGGNHPLIGYPAGRDSPAIRKSIPIFKAVTGCAESAFQGIIASKMDQIQSGDQASRLR